MKSVLFSVIILLSLSFQSCRDNFSVPTPASRNYQQDAAVLNEFVDINKTTHEYYINSNKRNSVLSYITNADVEELNSVNSLNLSIFKESLNQINSCSGQLAASHGVDYIVMITENEIYISQIKNDSPIELKKKQSDNGRYSSTVASLDVTDHKENYYINKGNHIETFIELNPQSYKNAGWAFYVTCHLRSNDNKETARILFCGIGYHINPCFEWSTTQGDYAEWNFETTSLNAPRIANFKFLR
ncbi:hypothetical protein ACMSFF_13390 [Bacteroides faecis]